jgi:hypothetical protein
MIAAVLLLLVAAVFIGSRLLRSDGSGDRFEKMWITTDDGKTFSLASARNLPPYTVDGKEAVQAMVFESKGTRFVGYMRKLTPEGKRQAEERQRTNKNITAFNTGSDNAALVLLKKPGGAKWATSLEPAGASAIAVRAPDGSMPTPVLPGE